MSWALVITLQIIASSLMTIFSRKLALSNRKLFYTIGVFSYGIVAVMGIVWGIIFQGGVHAFPSPEAWLYIVIEGICIPASWLLLYKIISVIGAANSTVTALVNTVVAAVLGIVFLHEPFTPSFLFGALLLLGSGYLALTIQADDTHRSKVSLIKKVVMVASMALLFAIGMYFEKKAIDSVGVWDYAIFGWSMQFVGALCICLFFGRSELAHITAVGARKGMLLGFMTSIAGVLYIYALSIGTLSHTVVATSGKLGLTMILAALILGERNAVRKRFMTLLLSMLGLYILFS